MNIKEIVKQYWKDFEIIAFNAVKNEMPQELISGEIITQSVKDGGYDGEIILISPNDDIEQILLEAKLRSNVSSDLPLQGFAKSLIIAIVKQASMIYIVTNLHFSDNTIDLLEKYSEKANLGIELLNGKSIKNFIQNHNDLLDEVNINLKNFLNNYTESFEEQYLNIKTFQHIQLNENYKKHSQFINFLTKNNEIQIITGDFDSGKTYYIEKLSEILIAQGNRVKTIDVSKHLTYRSFFLELLEKTFGLTIELFDIAGDDIFDSSLKKIIKTKNINDDIDMLKFIFSRIDSSPYDYSVMFNLMVKFFHKIYNIRKKQFPIIIAFENLIYASKEVLQLLQCLLNSNIKISCIIELSESDYCSSVKTDEWKSIKHNIINISKNQPKYIRSWKRAQAKTFLHKNISDLNSESINKLINKFGTSPTELSKLLTFIKNENLCNRYPKELLYNKIKDIDISNNFIVYNKCFDYMIDSNSDVLYVFVFLYLFNGIINKKLIEKYFDDPIRQIKCFTIFIESNLFIVDTEKIELKSKITNECFDEYCKSNLVGFVVDPVLNFINHNIKDIHLTQEMKFELETRENFFVSEYKYIKSLILLGNQYLKLSNLNLANKKFNEALEVIENSYNDINLSKFYKLLMYLGLIESEIWEIGEKEREIENYLNYIETKIIPFNSDSLDYKLQILRYYTLRYEFYHAQSKNEEAFSAGKKGVEWINSNDLYSYDLESCGKIWRYYAVATKELYNNIYNCLAVFEEGAKYCNKSAEFLLGEIVHKNMIIDISDIKERLRIKLDNYDPMVDVASKLSIDDFLHYRINIAALYFMQKDYQTAQKEYKKLLKKSDIFNITREKMRILNDMANICWINGDLEEAKKKYYIAKSTAELSGCTHNHWPILVNLVSFEVFNKNYFTAFQLHNELLPYLLEQCENLAADQLGFEKTDYCRAAFIIHLRNLLKIYKALNYKKKQQVIRDIKILIRKCKLIIYQENDSIKDLELKIIKLDLNGSEYDHGGLYLIKN